MKLTLIILINIIWLFGIIYWADVIQKLIDTQTIFSTEILILIQITTTIWLLFWYSVWMLLEEIYNKKIKDKK